MYQVIKMSDDEKRVMYKKIKKDKLIEMLISANNNLDYLIGHPQVDVPKEELINEDKSINYVLTFSIGAVVGLLIGYFYWFN